MTECDIDYLGLIIFIDIDNNYYLFLNYLFELDCTTYSFTVLMQLQIILMAKGIAFSEF